MSFNDHKSILFGFRRTVVGELLMKFFLGQWIRMYMELFLFLSTGNEKFNNSTLSFHLDQSVTIIVITSIRLHLVKRRFIVIVSRGES